MMTLNEAKEVFINRAFMPTDDGSGRIYDPDKWREACHVISKWLEQEPCDDAISRQATVERLCKVAEFMNEKRNGLGSPYIMAALFIQDNKDEFPSVAPTQGWIPVSERLPEKNVEVLATTTWGAITIAERYSANDFFIHEGTTNADIDDVIAWMPLPKSYMEVEE